MNRIGRLERLTRRMLAESNAEPIRVAAVLKRAYPNTQRFTWHWRSLWRAKNKFAVSAGRGWLGPTEALRRQIRGQAD
jgi:hypothetical protein